MPGPVDGQHGIPVRPPIMPGWHAYPVAARLRRTFGCPVLLENDVNLRALGEARALPADQAPLLFVKVGTGIGGGLITGAGELHHGADGAAGDIGHVRVRGGPDVRCVCGNVGCIEALASASAIARRLGAESGGEATIADVRALVARGDPTVLRLVREAAELIGEVVATLVHFYNPARVTIGGSVAAASDDLLAGIRSVVYQRALPLATRNLVLANSVLGEFAGVAGAAVLGIERVLSADGIGVLMDAPGEAPAAPLRLTGPCGGPGGSARDRRATNARRRCGRRTGGTSSGTADRRSAHFVGCLRGPRLGAPALAPASAHRDARGRSRGHRGRPRRLPPRGPGEARPHPRRARPARRRRVRAGACCTSPGTTRHPPSTGCSTGSSRPARRRSSCPPTAA